MVTWVIIGQFQILFKFKIIKPVSNATLYNILRKKASYIRKITEPFSSRFFQTFSQTDRERQEIRRNTQAIRRNTQKHPIKDPYQKHPKQKHSLLQ